jgi:hypothetical protein
MMLDPRGPRFAAAVTSVVLIVVLLTASGWLALAQAVVFAIGAVNFRYAPYSVLFRLLVAPRLAPPAEREPAEPVRFSQAVGFMFLAVGATGYLAGAPVVGLVATGMGLAAAFLNAAFGFCLGCELYVLLRRLTARA